MDLLEVNLTILCVYVGVGRRLWVGPPEFLTLRGVHTEPTAIRKLPFSFSYPGTSSRSGFFLLFVFTFCF